MNIKLVTIYLVFFLVFDCGIVFGGEIQKPTFDDFEKDSFSIKSNNNFEKAIALIDVRRHNIANVFASGVASLNEDLKKTAVGVYQTISNLFGSDDQLQSFVDTNNDKQVTFVKTTDKKEEDFKPSVGQEEKKEGKIIKIDEKNSQIIQQTIVTNPIKEVVKETIIEKIVSGVTSIDLQNLNNELRAEIYRVADNASTHSNNNYQAIALTNKIDNLTSVKINNSTITGGTISGATVTGTTGSFSGALSLSGTLSGTSGTFTGEMSVTGDLSTGGQLTVSGIATSTMAGDFAFDTSTLYIDSINNRIGIGTTSPFAKLSVKGAGTTTGINFQTTNSSDTPLITVLDSGNVGIGTVAPSYKFSILSSSTGQIVSNRALSVSTAGATFDTTAGVLTNSGGHFSSNASRSAGANDLTNIGVYTIATTAQKEYGIYSYVNPGGFISVNELVGTYNDVFAMSSDVNSIYGTKNYTTIFSSGTVSNVYGTSSYIESQAGTVDNIYGNYVDMKTYSSVANAYGFYVDDISAEATNIWALYTNGVAKSYFGGNVGIGTTSPQTLLTVGSSTPSYLLTGDKYNSAYVSGLLEVGGTGTSTVASNLYVVGTLRSTNSYVGDLIFSNGFRFVEAPSTTTPQALFLNNQDGENMLTVTENGDIGIGTTSPEYKLHVIGDIAATSFVNISTASAKKDITYLSGENEGEVLTKIKGMSIALYRYNIENEDDPVRLGLIAEESPKEILSAGGEGVDIYKLSTFILAGVKAQQKQIDGLELRVANLEQLIAGGSQSASGVGIEGVMNYLEGLGVRMMAGVSYFRDVVVEKLTAGKVVTNGIEMKDEVTGEIYCVKIRNGVMVNVSGECSSDVSQTQNGGGQTQTNTTPPTIQILGNNSAQIELNSTYVDLGVIAQGSNGNDLSVTLLLNGATTTQISLDTSTSTAYIITYITTDNDNQTTTAEREVIVGDSAEEEPSIDIDMDMDISTTTATTTDAE